MKLLPVRISWRTSALVLVNGLLMMAVGLRVWKGTETDRILHVPAHQVKIPSLHLELSVPYTDFTGLTDRTPFYASRRFYAPPSKQEVTAPSVPNYLFAGAVIRPHGPAVALLNDVAKGSTLRVIAGKDLDGWHVESIEASRVVLRYEDQRAEIKRATKQVSQSEATGGISRVRVTSGNSAQSGGGVRVLANGQLRDGQTVSRGTPAVANLPPLAGSGSEPVNIPPPPR